MKYKIPNWIQIILSRSFSMIKPNIMQMILSVRVVAKGETYFIVFNLLKDRLFRDYLFRF